MSKIETAIEISSSAIKLVVGYELDGEVKVLHAVTKAIPHGIVTSDGINDFETVCMGITSLVKDANNALSMEIKKVILALPPIGFEVYENTQSTSIVSSTGVIAELDIRNVMALLRRDRYSGENLVVDLIPIKYYLDQNRTFSNVPIGETSASLHMEAFVHTLPPRIVNEYRKAIKDVSLDIEKMVVTPYGVANLFTTYKEIPQQYVLIDMGANNTIVSIVDRGRPVASTYLNNGGNNITAHIANVLKLNHKDAEFLKCNYGMDDSVTSFKPTIATTVDSEGQEIKYSIKDLKRIIIESLDLYIDDIKRALNTLFQGNDTIKLPFVLVGGNTKLNGLKKYFEQKFANNTLLFPRIKSLGARTPAFTNCLGIIKVGANAIIDEERDTTKVAPLTREKTKLPKYSEVEDKL